MLKEKPLQGEPVRGNTTSTITNLGHSDKIPLEAFNALESEVAGLIHGTVTLTIYIKDGHLTRYAINREQSYVPGRPMTGSA